MLNPLSSTIDIGCRSLAIISPRLLVISAALWESSMKNKNIFYAKGSLFSSITHIPPKIDEIATVLLEMCHLSNRVELLYNSNLKDTELC